MAPTRGSASAPAVDLVVNGEPRSLDATALTVAELVEDLGLGGRRVAVEVGGRIVPRARHAEHALSEGDEVEIVHFVGGGA